MLAPRIQAQIGTNSTQGRGFHRKSKYYMTLFLLFLALFAVLAALLTAFVDPLQFYHKSSWYTPLLSEEERYQNPGLAKNYDYDNIIIGTSMTENFLPSQVDQSIGGTTLKLSMEGSTVDEHYKIARLALETGKVKQVIWGLDYFSLKLETGDVADEFPDYLYDGKLWTDYKYWFNSSVYTQFGLSIKSILNHETGTDLEHLNNWNDEVIYGKKYVAKSYFAAADNEQYFGLNEESTAQLQEHFNTFILPLLKAYPEVKFYFYYPPYSVMRQVAWYSDNPVRFNNQLIMRKWMYEQFRQFDNVSLYDFQTESKWTFNLDLYKDISHHSGDVNAWIAEAIGAQDTNYLVTEDHVDALNERLESQAESAVMDKSGNIYQSSVKIAGVPMNYTARLVQGNEQLWLSAKEMAAALGASMKWDAAQKTVTLSSSEHSVVMTVGSSEALVDNKSITLEAAPLLVGGKALLPLAFTAEQLGWKVAFQQADRWLRYDLTFAS